MDKEIVFDNYRPGLMGEVVAWHGRYYAKNWNFGPEFEAIVGSGLADFIPRKASPGCQIFSAWQQNTFLGSITVDNDGNPNQKLAHIRWFIMSDAARGKKVGGALFAKAIDFIQQSGYSGVYLTTFKGLEAAQHLYTQAGFQLTHEEKGNSWGTEVIEQRYELHF